jgi:DNA-binding XRE family transcriptional regulator
MVSPQVIKEDGKPAFAVIPWTEWLRLSRLAGLAEKSDEDLFREGMASLAAGEETYPMELVDRLLADENAVKVFREHRGLTQAVLAAKAGIGAPYLAQIEQGVRRGSLKTLRRLAAALAVDLDFLLPREPQR